jgi:hypothetical protein
MRDEMERQFSRLVASAPTGAPLERWIASGIERALREYEDGPIS